MTEPTPRLRRALGVRDAVMIGLAAMVGAGVFSVWAPAAQSAGAWLLAAVAVAAVVAFANAGSTAQLAVQHPESGGVYRYGRARLGEWPGFLAGWAFIVGKTASCAAMALVASAYLVPEPWQKPVAVAAVVTIVGVDVLGVTRTARVASVLVVGVLAVLGLVVAAAVMQWLTADAGSIAVTGPTQIDGSTPLTEQADDTSRPASAVPTLYGVLQAAGLIFFAFAGYARIATLGEEVRDPTRTIPRAIGMAFAVVVVVYLAVGAATLATLGASRLARSDAPLADVVSTAGWTWAVPIVGIAAGVAALGSLLVLVAGISRTSLAMARDDELPRALARVHPRFSTPFVAEVVVGVAVVALVLATDLRGAIGFSSFGVLLYYLVANAAALTQPRGERLIPRWLSVVGASGCLVLAVTLPWPSIVAGVVVLAVGVLWRVIRRRMVSVVE